MKKKEKAAQVVAILEQHYEATCSLVAEKDYELLFSVRLAAQCTDERVNQVTPGLFSRFPTLEALAAADAFADGEFLKELALYLAQRDH